MYIYLSFYPIVLIFGCRIEEDLLYLPFHPSILQIVLVEIDKPLEKTSISSVNQKIYVFANISLSIYPNLPKIEYMIEEDLFYPSIYPSIAQIVLVEIDKPLEKNINFFSSTKDLHYC